MNQQMLTIWSLFSLRFLNPAWTSGNAWFMCCWSLAWRILSITLQRVRWVHLCGSLNILWHCLSLWLEGKLTFSSPVVTAEFSKFAGILNATLSFFFLFYFIFKFYIIVLVLPNIKMNPLQVYMCSPSWTLLPPPSPYHPSGSSQCTSPKHLALLICRHFDDGHSDQCKVVPHCTVDLHFSNS